MSAFDNRAEQDFDLLVIIVAFLMMTVGILCPLGVTVLAFRLGRR